MNHRHLLPDEFDLLVDGEEGFGVAPLLAHVEECPACRSEVDDRRRVVAALERLPHFTPGPLFAHRVMSDVRVFEPWYVPALETMQRLVPRSKIGRVFAGATAGLVATTLTIASVWVSSRLDVVAFLANVLTTRARGSATMLAGSMVSSALGDATVASLRGSGTPVVAVTVATFLVTVIAAAFSLRAVAAVSRRRRS